MRSDTESTVRQRLTFAVVAVSGCAMALLQSVVVPVLPELRHALHTDAISVAWVLTAMLLSASICTPIIGRLADIVGHKKTYVGTLLVLGAGAILAAFATDLPTMIAARVLQGVGGGMLPAAFGIVRARFPAARVAGAIGAIAALIAAGFGLGVVLAGPIESTLGLTALFGIPAAMVLLAAAAAAWIIPADEIGFRRERINWAAAAALAAWLLTLLLAISRAPGLGWTSAPILGLLGTALMACALWAWIELRSRTPLIDLRAMRPRAVWTGNLSSFLLGIGMFAAFTALPALLQSPADTGFGHGLDATTAGLVIVPVSVGMFVLGLCAGPLTRRHGARALLIVGSAVGAAGFVVIAALHASLTGVVTGSVLLGIGLGLAFSAVTNLVVAAVEPAQTGMVSGMNVNIRTIGGALGAALVATLVTVGGPGDGVASGGGYTLGFAVIAVAMVASAVVAAMAPRQRSRASDTEKPVSAGQEAGKHGTWSEARREPAPNSKDTTSREPIA